MTTRRELLKWATALTALPAIGAAGTSIGAALTLAEAGPREPIDALTTDAHPRNTLLWNSPVRRLISSVLT
jgi:hypothetical protein